LIPGISGPDKVHRQYIPEFARIVQPLNRLTANDVPWQWYPVKQQAFDRLKGCLLKAPILAYPDLTQEYILFTDASDHNVSAVQSQVQEGREVVVAYYSKSLSAAEKNYCTTRKELLAVIKAVKHFRPYLYGRMFWLRTDHASLIWLSKRAEPWDSLWSNGDRHLTITLAANGRCPERERVVCSAAICRELIWETYKQAHAGVQRVVAKVQLWWYWPKMGRDVRLKVRQLRSARPVSMVVSLVKWDG